MQSNPDRETELNAHLALSGALMRYDTVAFLDHLEKAEAISETACDKIKCLNRRLRYASETGEVDEADEIISKLYKLDYKDCPDAEAEVKVSQGNHYDISGRYPEALEAYLVAERVYRDAGNLKGVGITQMGIGNIYNLTDRNEMAIEYFRKSWLGLKPVHPLYASWSLNNMATCYNELGLLDSALYFFQESLKTKLELNDEYGASYSYTDIGAVYFKKEELEKRA